MSGETNCLRRTMEGPDYRDRCLSLGFSVNVLAEMLGVDRRAMFLRFKPGKIIRTEAVLALQMLEHRVLSGRYDKLLSKANGTGKKFPPPSVGKSE